MNFYTDYFINDSYSRRQTGLGINVGYYFFPEDFPLGLLAQVSFGTSFPSVEEIPRESMDARKTNILDIRVAVAPSFRFRLGPKIQLPVSLGPIFIFQSEKNTEDILLPGQSAPVSRSHSYNSLNGGIHADAAFLFLVSQSFFLKPGISFDYIFLRAEKGEMWMNYRTTHKAHYKGVPYNAFNFAFYFGLGWQF